MQVIGLCRFSYLGEGGFQVEHGSLRERAAYLYDETRMETRFAQFETITLPGLKAQTDPDFTFVIVVGDSMPPPMLERLHALLDGFAQAQVQAHPPGPHRKVMQAAINAAKSDPAAPCLQFRHDDDDAVAVDFVEKLRALARANSGVMDDNRLVAFDFDHGYAAEPGPHGLRVSPQTLTLYGVALAMAVQGNVGQTIMNFAHKKLGRFMPVITDHSPAMFVRGHSDFNDSRQKPGVAPLALSDLDPQTELLFRDRFAIDAAHVRRVFSAL